MSDTTSILDLRSDPIGGGNISNNISLTATENVVIQNPQQQNMVVQTLDEKTISQIVNGIQQASASGSTLLPSRDIPMTTTNIINDAQIQPNYIPMSNQNIDYIDNHEETSDIIENYNRSVEQNNTMEDIYNEFQTPLLLAILYFLFQLPFFKKFLFNYMSFLFLQDGNLNINGFIFKSVLFGFIFYILDKSMRTFSKF
jgi:hypothetical protein